MFQANIERNDRIGFKTPSRNLQKIQDIINSSTHSKRRQDSKQEARTSCPSKPWEKKSAKVSVHITHLPILGLSRLGLLVVVNVKEIGVKQRLDDSSNNADRLEGTLEGGFGEIAEDPVRDVECPIES